MLPASLLGAFLVLAAPARAAVEERVDVLLADLLGAGRAHAFVRPQPPPPAGEDAADPADAPTALWDRMNERLRRAPPVLPGYPAPQSLREEALRELLREAGGERRRKAEPEPALSVSLVVDDALTEAELRRASDAVAQALALSAERGDALRVSRAPLAPDWPKAIRDPALHAAAVAGGATGAAVLAGLVLVALALRSRRAAPIVLAAPAAAPAAPAWTPPVPPAPGPRPEPAEPSLPRLDEGGVAVCSELLRDGPDAAAAWLLGRADPAEAAAVYARLPPTVRLAAARRLIDASGPTPGAPGSPAELADRLQRLVSGQDRLEEILLRLGEDQRLQTVAHLRPAAPAAAARLASLPYFGDLATAGPEDLRLLLSPFSCSQLAAALAAEPAAVRTAFLDALPAVVADLVRERLASAAPERGGSQRGEVLSRWRRLERAGRVRRLGDAAAAG